MEDGTVNRTMFGNRGTFAALTLLLAFLVSSTMQADVQPPLYADIEPPEGGFRVGVQADLDLVAWIPQEGENLETTLELTLSASGVARTSGKTRWVINNVTIGEPYRVTATVWIAGDGEGQWRLEASSYYADGTRAWGNADRLSVLQADGEILHGKVRSAYLLLEKLEQDRNKGLLDDQQYQRERDRMRAGEKLDIQKRLEGLPVEEEPLPEKKSATVDQTTVSGRIRYTPRTGRAGAVDAFATNENARPLVGMLVEFYDRQNADTAIKLATAPAEVRTNATGNFSGVRVPGRRAGEPDTAVNLEVTFVLDSPAARVLDNYNPVVGHSEDNLPYVIRMPAQPVTTATMPEIDHVVTNANLNHLRWSSILDMAHFAYTETRALITRTSAGVNPVQIPIYMPPDRTYFWTRGGNHICQEEGNAFDWDVFLHEYGHYIQELNDTAENPGGRHTVSGNLTGYVQSATSTLTKEQGIKMAWAEAWPTYYGTFLQIAGGAGEFGIFAVGDLRYTDSDLNFSYHLEENAEYQRANGEDTELAVQRILWDFADAPQDENDEVNFGHEQIWKLLHTAPKPLSLNDFRNKMENELPPAGVAYYSVGTQQQNRVRYGGVYHDHNVGPAPLTPAVGFTGATPPRFSWNRRGGGPAPSYRFDKFTVQFYNKDFTEIIFTSPEIPTAGGALTSATVAEWTPSEAQWTEIMEHGDVMHWGVLGSHDGPPVTGPYLGLTRLIGGPSISFVIDDTGSMGPEIGGVRTALTNFITLLRTAEMFFGVEPLIEVITFKDNVSHRIAARDLDAVQGVVSSLYASGGDDCPEASAQALHAAVKNMAAGGMLIFATDASPHRGYSLEGIKRTAMAKGITIIQIVTGDCIASSPDGFKSGDAIMASSCNPGHIPGPEEDQPVEYWSNVFCDDCPTGDFEGLPMTPNILRILGDWTLPPVSSVVAFTDIASASPTGHFLYMPDSRYGDPESLVNVVTNAAIASILPTVLAVQPKDGQQGATMDVLIAGGQTNFRNSSVVSFSGDGITVNSIEAISPTEMVANISIDEEAELSRRDVSVSTPLGAGTVEETQGTGQFRVITNMGFPALTSVTPRANAQGTTVMLHISGINTNFEDGVTEVLFGEGIFVDAVFVDSPTSLRVEITIDADAPLGFRTITVQTDIETVRLQNTLALVETLGLAKDAPTIASVTPEALPRASVGLDLQVVGKNTNFINGETETAFSGLGITVESTTVTGPTLATVRVSVDTDAALGARDIIMTTGGQTAVKSQGITVVEEGFGAGCGCCRRDESVKGSFRRYMADWLLVGATLLVFLALTTKKKVI